MNQFLPVGPQSFFIIQLHYHYNVANYGLLKEVVTCCDVPAVSVPQSNYEGTRKLHGQEFQRAFPGCMLELCLHPPGAAWQRASKYNSTVVVTYLLCSFSVSIHSSSLLFHWPHTPSLQSLLVALQGKIIWFPFRQNIALLKSAFEKARWGKGGREI